MGGVPKINRLIRLKNQCSYLIPNYKWLAEPSFEVCGLLRSSDTKDTVLHVIEGSETATIINYNTLVGKDLVPKSANEAKETR